MNLIGDNMNFYEELKTMTSEEIKKHLFYEINSLENISKNNHKNYSVLGYDASYNPTDYDFLNEKPENEINVNFSCFYGGYIPKGMKVVYGLSANTNGTYANDGMYYIVDDDSYIYEFCEYIKDKKVNSEGDFFEYILWFLKKYFGVFKNTDRDGMFKMILKNNTVYLDPVQEHKLSSFKNKGNAMCSEYSIMANNILNVFGFDSYVIMGQEKDDKGSSGHAFNFVSYINKDYERINILIDFSNGVNIYDMKFHKVGDSPYVLELEELNSEMVDDFIMNEKHIVAPDYSVMVMGDSLFELTLTRNRDYYVRRDFLVKIMSTGYQKCKKMC